MSGASAKEVVAALNARIGELARELLGEPNRELSTPTQLRFGTHGSIAVELGGDDAGRWFDHEHGMGGAGIELLRHRRGLSNGAALDWSRQWLGMPAAPRRQKADPAPAPAAPTSDAGDAVLPADTTAPAPVVTSDEAPGPPPWQDRPSSSAAKKATEDAKRAAKVAEIVAGCEDAADTRVQTYLRRRAITASPLPPSIRFLPNAYNHYGALVALATDAQGQVHGLQLIYLTEDGRKAPLKVHKRTNKAHDGWADAAAVRLPGTAPLVLCEGVETALSVWQATGQETWACLGISNIARAPVPDGAPVIVARDGDEPNSKADQQLRQAVTLLRVRGHDVTVAEPPPGQDFNDVL